MLSHIQISLETRSLRNILNAAFALIFAIPFLIFFYNVVRFDLLDHDIIRISFLGFLAFAMLGFVILRRIMDRIIELTVAAESAAGVGETASTGEHNELQRIAETFHKLMSRLEENTSNLGRRVAELAALKELSEMSTKSADLDHLFGIVLEKLMVTTDTVSGIMFSISAEGKTMRIESARGIEDSSIPQHDLFPKDTISGRVLGETRLLVTGDPSAEEGYNPAVDSVFCGPFIARAITARGRTIGVLTLSRGKNGKPFTDSELDYISTVLGQVAFSFDNAELIRELRDSYAELKEMQEKLINYERVAAIHQTVVTLSDRINNPLTIIQGHTELLRKDFSGGDEHVLRSLDAILNSCCRCGDIMRQLREIQDPAVVEYAGTGLQMIDVNKSGTGTPPGS